MGEAPSKGEAVDFPVGRRRRTVAWALVEGRRRRTVAWALVAVMASRRKGVAVGYGGCYGSRARGLLLVLAPLS